MPTDKQRSRSARKGVLTKETTKLELIIEEQNFDNIIAEREKYKQLYRNFYRAHEEYHDTIIIESEIDASECYLEDVQKTYTVNLRKLNDAIDKLDGD